MTDPQFSPVDIDIESWDAYGQILLSRFGNEQIRIQYIVAREYALMSPVFLSSIQGIHEDVEDGVKEFLEKIISVNQESVTTFLEATKPQEHRYLIIFCLHDSWSTSYIENFLTTYTGPDKWSYTPYTFFENDTIDFSKFLR